MLGVNFKPLVTEDGRTLITSTFGELSPMLGFKQFFFFYNVSFYVILTTNPVSELLFPSYR